MAYAFCVLDMLLCFTLTPCLESDWDTDLTAGQLLKFTTKHEVCSSHTWTPNNMAVLSL